jgi:adenine-specific DNA-methyltransferase
VVNFHERQAKIRKRIVKWGGVICCHIDNNEGEYVKVLLDEIYGRENYLNTFYIRVRYPDKTLKQDMDFHKEMEFIHIYRKSNLGKPNLNKIEVNNDKYVFFFEEKSDGREITLGGKKVIVFEKNEIVVTQKDADEKGRKEIWATGSILDGNSSGRFFRDYLDGRAEQDGLGVIYKVFGVGDETDGFRYFSGPQKASATKGKYYQGIPNSTKDETNKQRNVPINNFYDLAGSFGNCRLEGGVEFRAGKKPEELLKLIIHHFSNVGDIVLDYHLGSGSTCAVAHKMDRKYIGIEQLDYNNSDSVVRLNNVIQGEQSGISKETNWQGGGSFVYMELAKANQHFVEQIQAANTEGVLLELWEQMQAEAFISYKVTPDMIDKNNTHYEALSFEDKKRFLIETLDKNLLYVPHCDMEDKAFGLTDTDKAVTTAFYNLKNEA